jgi:hypothetical protein
MPKGRSSPDGGDPKDRQGGLFCGRVCLRQEGQGILAKLDIVSLAEGDGGPQVEKPYSGENRLLQSLAPADLAALQPQLKPVELRRSDVLHQGTHPVKTTG